MFTESRISYILRVIYYSVWKDRVLFLLGFFLHILLLFIIIIIIILPVIRMNLGKLFRKKFFNHSFETYLSNRTYNVAVRYCFSKV